MSKANSRCPICKKPSRKEFSPFCSKHCADIDLGRWFSGNYFIPSAPQNEEETKELYNSIKERLDPDDDVG